MSFDGNSAVWLSLLSFLVLAGKVWDWWTTQQAAKKLAVVTEEAQVQTAAKVAEVKRAADLAAVKVAEVKTTLAIGHEELKGGQQQMSDKLDQIEATGEKVHLLSNNAMSLVLKAHALSLERIAEMTEHPADVAAAKVARQASDAHDARQALVDAAEVARQKNAQP